MDRLNTPDSDKGNREVPLRTSEIKATYHEKRPSRIAPEPGFVSQNSLTKTKLLPQNAAGVSVEQHKDPGIKTTSDVLILGTSGSGKSLLLRRLKNIEGMIEADTLPTVGTDIDRVSINKKEILFREVGFKLVHSWIKFSRETKAIMFVVDLADYASISASVIEFYNILLCVEDLPTPVILVLNKVDRQDHLSIDTVLKMFEFSELLEVRENLYLYVISAASGVNTRPLADLLESIVGPNAQNQGKKKRKCCF